jgi:hypothetical protein
MRSTVGIAGPHYLAKTPVSRSGSNHSHGLDSWVALRWLSAKALWVRQVDVQLWVFAEFDLLVHKFEFIAQVMANVRTQLSHLAIEAVAFGLSPWTWIRRVTPN